MAAAAGPFLAKTIIGFAFGKMLSSLLTPDKRSPLNTSKPAALSERGSPIPLLIGRDLVAPVFAWEGRRITRNEPLNGGQGGKGVGAAGGGSQNVVHYADGLHILSVGPGKRLRAIRANGEQVWPHSSSGTGGETSVDQDLGIEPHTSPSGSSFDLADGAGQFTIYWGEPDQPSDFRLEDADGLGTSANWSYIAYVYWDEARLGGAGTWPAFEYDWEVGPFNELQTHTGPQSGQDYTSLSPALSGSQAWLENGLAVDSSSLCLDILTYDPATSTLTCGGSGVLPLLGFKCEIRDNSSAADGRWVVESATAGPAVTIPSGGFSNSKVCGIPGVDVSPFDDCLLVSGTVTSRISQPASTDPPGTVCDGLTSGFMGSNPQGGTRMLLTAATPTAGNDTEAFLRFDNPTTGGTYKPSAAYIVTTVYVKSPAVGDPAVKVRGQFETFDFAGGGTYAVNTSMDFLLEDGDCVQYGSSVGTIDTTITELGDRWWKLRIRSAGLPTGGGVDGHVPGFKLISTADSASPNQGTQVEIAYGASAGFEYLIRTQGSTSYASSTTLTLSPGPTSVAPYVGEMCELVSSEKGPQGANMAHILYQLLFQSAPHGLGLDEDCYDIASLQAIGTEIWNNGQGEGLRSHIRSNPDDSIEGLVEQCLAEAGIQRYWDVVQGKWGFKLVREEPAEATFPEDLIAPDPPEVGRSFGSETLTDLRFVFRDSTINYRENDVYIPLDGESATAVQRQALQTVRDEASAQIVSDRFAQIEQGRPASVTVLGLRDSQLVRVGDVLDFGNLLGPGVLYRTTQVKLDPMRAVTELTLASEQYSVEPGNAVSTPVDAGSGVSLGGAFGRTVAPDQDFDVWEASAFLGRKVQFVPLRVPSEEDATLSAFLASSDGVSYLAETATATMPCGVLVSEFSATETAQVEPGVNSFEGSFYIEDGPLFRAQANSVVGRVRTLGDADWGAGRQWLLINNEVMYVQEFEPLGDDLWRAKHVLRARLDSQRDNHAEGDSCYILDSDSLGLFEVPYAGRGQTMQVKSIPAVGNNSAPPATVTAKATTPSGKGISPIRLSHLREENFVDKWRVRDTVYRWDYSLPEGLETRTGLGMQGAGELTSTSQDVWPGKFTVALADSGNNIIYGPVITTDNEIFVPSSAYSSAAAGNITLLVLAVDEFGADGVRIQKTFPQA